MTPVRPVFTPHLPPAEAMAASTGLFRTAFGAEPAGVWYAAPKIGRASCRERV